MSVQPNFFKFVGLILLFGIYIGMKKKFNFFVDLEI